MYLYITLADRMRSPRGSIARIKQVQIHNNSISVLLVANRPLLYLNFNNYITLPCDSLMLFLARIDLTARAGSEDIGAEISFCRNFADHIVVFLCKNQLRSYPSNVISVVFEPSTRNNSTLTDESKSLIIFTK